MVVDGTRKDVGFFSEKLEALKVLQSKKTEQIASVKLSIIKKNRKKYGEFYFYTNESMFGLLTTESENVLESYLCKGKVNKSYPIKIKPKAITKGIFISNILTVQAIIKYKMLQDNMSYKPVTRGMYLDILPTKYHEEFMGGIVFSILLSILFQKSPLNFHLQNKKTDKK